MAGSPNKKEKMNVVIWQRNGNISKISSEKDEEIKSNLKMTFNIIYLTV